VGGQGVVGEVVGQEFHGDEEHVDVEHPPVEPTPLFLVLGLLLHRFIKDHPLSDLVGEIKGPRDDLAPFAIHDAAFFGNLSKFSPLRIVDQTVGISHNSFLVFETFNAEFAIKPNFASGVTENNRHQTEDDSPHDDEIVIPPESAKAVGGSQGVFIWCS